MHASTLRLTHGSTVLLDYGDLLTAEPDLGWGQTVQEVPRARAGDADLYARGGAVRTLTVSWAVYHATLAAARAHALAWTTAIPTTRAILYADVQGGPTYQWGQAIIADATCALRDRSLYTLHTLTIRASGIAVLDLSAYLLLVSTNRPLNLHAGDGSTPLILSTAA